MTNISRHILSPGVYRHYKNKLYAVIDVAQNTETEEIFVVYRALYGDCLLWVRPISMFVEKVKINGKEVPRFELIRPFGEI